MCSPPEHPIISTYRCACRCTGGDDAGSAVPSSAGFQKSLLYVMSSIKAKIPPPPTTTESFLPLFSSPRSAGTRKNRVGGGRLNRQVSSGGDEGLLLMTLEQFSGAICASKKASVVKGSPPPRKMLQNRWLRWCRCHVCILPCILPTAPGC